MEMTNLEYEHWEVNIEPLFPNRCSATKPPQKPAGIKKKVGESTSTQDNHYNGQHKELTEQKNSKTHWAKRRKATVMRDSAHGESGILRG